MASQLKSKITLALIIASISQLSLVYSLNGGARIMESQRLENFLKEKIVPDVIDEVPKASIGIKYPSGAEVKQGNELTPTQVKDVPKFQMTAKPGELYTLAMIDPDAPSRSDPKKGEFVHFMIVNIPGRDVEKGQVAFEYVGSGPPKGSGLHRYIFLLYHQKSPSRVDKVIPKTSLEGRKQSIRKYAKEHNLGQPVAGNFYQAQWDDYVPKLYAQFSM